MKQSEAIQHLNIMVKAIQRARSIERESLEGNGYDKESIDTTLEYLSPWLFGKKNPLPTLIKVLDGIELGKELEPLYFYNLVVIATTLALDISAMCNVIGTISEIPDYEFPKEADIQWLRGWDKE